LNLHFLLIMFRFHLLKFLFKRQLSLLIRLNQNI
jgi:hypothetical protein